MDDSANDRAELLALRARLAVTERVAWLGAELAAIMRPAETLEFLTAERERLAEMYATRRTDAPSLSASDSDTVAAEVDRRFADLIATVIRASRIT